MNHEVLELKMEEVYKEKRDVLIELLFIRKHTITKLKRISLKINNLINIKAENKK